MTRPNILLILADDLGYSDLGCYGGEIRTPNLDRLAEGGTRLTQFYTTARCSPSRASLLTGLHPHQTGIGILTGDDSPVGYPGTLNRNCATIAEILSQAGYATGMTGKWHLAADTATPNDAWPTRRGFDYFYGTLTGCGSYYSPGTLVRGEQNIESEADDPGYYYTDAITREAVGFIDRAASGPDPFLLYVAYTAPHWPLHAPQEAIDRYQGRFDAGWDVLRRERFDRQRQLGLIRPDAELSPREPEEAPWAQTPDQKWQARRMETYAAQVELMDQGVGRLIAALEERGQLENTIVVFLSDNGASPEELPHMDRERFIGRTDIFRPSTRTGAPVRLGNEPSIPPGPEDSYTSYGRPWANLSNTPFRYYKKWTHEGGIAAPFILHWPAGQVRRGMLEARPLQLVHVLPTLLEATGTVYPRAIAGHEIPPLEGTSFLPQVRNGAENGLQSPPSPERQGVEAGTLYWEHGGNGGIRQGDWKLVRDYPQPWELYDLAADPTELRDLAADHRELAENLLAQWAVWADRVGVLSFGRIVDLYQLRGRPANEAAG